MKSNMSTLIAILTGIFTGAKLASAISWSWWIVFSPAIVYFGWIALVIAFIMLIHVLYLLFFLGGIIWNRIKTFRKGNQL